MKKTKLFTFILFFLFIFTKTAYSIDKIAVLDLDSLLEKTNYGKKIIADLNLLNEQNLKSLQKIESRYFLTLISTFLITVDELFFLKFLKCILSKFFFSEICIIYI